MNDTIKSHASGIAWMLAGSLLTAGLGKQVPPWMSPPSAETEASAPAEEPEPEETVPEEEALPEPEALPNVLNLINVFPEGADRSDVLSSTMGMIYQELQILDQNWLDGIYNLSGMTPAQMADQLGLPPDSVMGSYNRKDENQDIGDPSTWKVGSWKRIHVNVLDGDGMPASGDSNVKEILSMANVYTYFHDYRDSELFSRYAEKLWEASHSYEVSMSDVYYCDGCMNLTENEEMAEDIADLQAEEGLPFPQDLSAEAGPELPDQTREMTGPGIALTYGTDGFSEAWAASSETAAVEDTEVSPAETAAAVFSASPSEIREPGDYVEMLNRMEQAGEEPESDMSLSDSSASPSSLSIDPMSVSCPGHLDLTVTVHITGLTESNSLYVLDPGGAGTVGSPWEGWTEEMKAYAEDLNRQDWYENYGLTISNIALQMSMSPDEIDFYMDMLPTGLSAERAAVIRFALESVGRVPYYWGGKPAASGYLGNMFGSLITPDYKGRIKRGLDCSGWISWVYWSATGKRLPAEGTSGLISCGTGISRSQLQPGDIIVRTGPNAHVVMFLAWGNDGKILCIHETSGPANNVTISELDANWKYYRKLID